VHHGVARLDGVGRVAVELAAGGTTTYAARRGVVLNTGTRPAAPPIDGLAGTPYWTNRDAVRATGVPSSLVVIGGGPIGCELAQVFARFGARVTVVQHGERLLPADEPEASALLGRKARNLAPTLCSRQEHQEEGDRDGRRRPSNLSAPHCCC